MSERSIDYTVVAGPLGRILLAATERGVCFVALGASEGEVRRRLEREFPFAPLRRDDAGLRPWSRALERYVAGRCREIRLPLDVRGSRFQRRVWDALRRIPRGETRAYAEVAASIGLPRGARAVARACAENPVPILIPCHRVVGRDGSLAGYAYGVRRKRALLATEARGGRGPAAPPREVSAGRGGTPRRTRPRPRAPPRAPRPGARFPPRRA